MDRHPWRTRAGALAIVNALAGLALALGFGVDAVDHWVGVLAIVVNLGVTVGLVRDGEAQSTPLADPRDNQGRQLTPRGL
jgi:hypothetical protein